MNLAYMEVKLIFFKEAYLEDCFWDWLLTFSDKIFQNFFCHPISEKPEDFISGIIFVVRDSRSLLSRVAATFHFHQNKFLTSSRERYKNGIWIFPSEYIRAIPGVYIHQVWWCYYLYCLFYNHLKILLKMSRKSRFFRIFSFLVHVAPPSTPPVNVIFQAGSNNI